MRIDLESAVVCIENQVPQIANVTMLHLHSRVDVVPGGEARPAGSVAGAMSVDVRDLTWDGPPDTDESLVIAWKGLLGIRVGEDVLRSMGVRLREYLFATGTVLSIECQRVVLQVLGALPRDAQLGVGEYLCYMGLGTSSRWRYDWAGAVSQLLRATQCADAVGDPRLRASARRLLSLALLGRGRFHESSQCMVEALQLAEDRERIPLLLNLGVYLCRAGLLRESIRVYALAEANMESAHWPETRINRVQVLANRAEAYWMVGDLRRAMSDLTRAFDLVQDLKESQPAKALELASPHCVMAWCLIDIDSFEEAAKHLEAARRITEGAPLHQTVDVRLLSAYLRIQSGDEEALREIDEAALSAGDQSDASTAAFQRMVAARAYARLGRNADAARHARSALSLAALMQEHSGQARVDKDQLARFWRLSPRVVDVNVANERVRRVADMAVVAALNTHGDELHVYRVAHLCAALASHIGWEREAVRAMFYAGLLHDVGCVALPQHSESIGARSRRDTDEQAHVLLGRSILEGLQDPEFALASDAAFFHHEHWDGTGYPQRLAGEAIPLCARIVAIADEFARRAGRFVDRASDQDRAAQAVAAGAGTRFDPALTEAFIACFAKLRHAHTRIGEYLVAGSEDSSVVSTRRRMQDVLAALKAEPSGKWT